MGVGARVAETIRTKIINPNLFKDNPQMLMLGMVCAVCGSSIFLTIATRLGMPVSTTHSIVGGVIGMGVASVGAKNITWWGGSISSGVVQVFLAWIFAPILAGCFASIVFLITKYGVLLRKNPIMKGFIAIPIYFGITSALLTSKLYYVNNQYRQGSFNF
jgi:sodium-dependent phosphate transporter